MYVSGITSNIYQVYTARTRLKGISIENIKRKKG
jgi:hypothetical protein